jgi:uncharacterized protein
MSPATRALIGAIRLYQRWVSPLFVRHCRFEPTCSSYAVEAISRHGAVRGLILAASRLARCHPWSAGGVDHVPTGGRP